MVIAQVSPSQRLQVLPAAGQASRIGYVAPAASLSALGATDQLQLSARALVSPAEQARRKAVETLQGNTWTVQIKGDPRPRQVVVAGKTHFQDLWGRDGVWGAMGTLAAGKPQVTKECLQAFMDFQFADGMFPRRIGPGSVEVNMILKTIGLHKPSRHFKTVDGPTAGAWWTGQSGAFPGHAPDTNMLVTIAAGDYVRQSGDRTFLQSYYPHLAKSLHWLQTHLNADSLLVQPGIGDWKDSVHRGHIVMYNQALFYQTLQTMGNLAETLGRREESAVYKAQAAGLKQKVQEKFWDTGKGHFIDSERYDHFSPDGNLFAVAFGLATPDQAARIFAHCDRLMAKHPILPATDGKYPWGSYGLPQRFLGMSDYHDRVRWPWLNSLYALAAQRAGDHARAVRVLDTIVQAVQRDGDFYETYQPDQAKPIDRLLYKSEKGFSWSAGMFLKAYAEVYGSAPVTG